MGAGGAAGISVTGTGGGAVGGDGAIGGSAIGGGAGGTVVVPPDPCIGATDARLVLASQRKLLLTSREIINMVIALVGSTEALMLLDSGIFQVTADVDRWFPPATSETGRSIPDEFTMRPYTNLADHVAKYVFDNFALVTGCASPETYACAKAFLVDFAARAYRRPLDTEEQAALRARYDGARNTDTVEGATRTTVAAILVAQQFLYRSEMGDATRPSLSPAGIPLTPYELASALSFFLTDGPPDQLLLNEAGAGTLTTATLGAHVDRLLATPGARVWLATVMEIFFSLNQLPLQISSIDPTQTPEISSALLADMQTEARKFIDFTLWNGNLTDLLTSRTTFLNTTLATVIYKVPIPVAATATNFVQTTLPVDQRSGLLTSAGFITTTAGSGRTTRVVVRGHHVRAVTTGFIIPPPPDALAPAEIAALRMFDAQTAQEQVAYRASIPVCQSCHVHIDGYGLPLETYDNIGRYRIIDDKGQPVDAHATLPPELGGGQVTNAIELARALATSPAFTNLMAWAMLQYAMVDYSAPVELPDANRGTAGCAVADLVIRFLNNRTRTFSALVREAVLSPAFSLRQPAQ